MGQFNASLANPVQIDPDEALAELARRGYRVDQSGTPGLYQRGMTIRPAAPKPPGYSGPTFKFSETPPPRQQQQPPQPTYRQAPAPRPDLPSVFDAFGYNVPTIQQPRPLARPGEDEQVASILQEQRRAGAGAFTSLSSPEQVQTAQNILRLRQAEGIDQHVGPKPDLEQYAAGAAARYEAVRKGEYSYGSVEEAAQDRQILQQWQQGRQRRYTQAKAESLGPVVGPVQTAISQGVNTLTFGGAAALRGGVEALRGVPLQERTTGFESALAAENQRSAIFGSVVGAGVPVAAAAYGSARLARIGLGALGAGATVQGIGAALAGFAGGNAVSGVNTFGTSLSQGMSVEDAAAEGFRAAGQYGFTANKLINGEPLDENDIMALAMLPLEFMGVYGDFADAARSMGKPTPLTAARRRLADAIQDYQNRGAAIAGTDEAARAAFDPAGGIPVRSDPAVVDEVRLGPGAQEQELPDFRSPAETLRQEIQGQWPHLQPEASRAADLAAIARQEAQAQAVGPALMEDPGAPLFGVPGSRVEQVGTGEYRTSYLDEMGRPFAQEIYPDAEAAARATIQTLPTRPPGPAELRLRAEEEAYPPPRKPRVTPEERAARPATMTADEVVAYAGKFEKSAEAIRPLLGDAEYEVRDVPVDEFNPLIGGSADFKASLKAAMATGDKAEVRKVLDAAIKTGDLSRKKLINASKAGKASDAPAIVAVGDDLQIADGTHRWVRAMLSGEKTIKAIVPAAKMERGTRPDRLTAERPANGAPGPGLQVPSTKSEVKPTSEMTVRQLREEAKRLGVPQYDNQRGQPKLRQRIEQARKQAPESRGVKSAPDEGGSATAADETPGPLSEAEALSEKPAQISDRPLSKAEQLLESPDFNKVKWRSFSDEAVAEAYNKAPEGSNAKKALEIQVKARGLEGQDLSPTGMARRSFEQKLRQMDRDGLAKAAAEADDEMVKYIAGKLKGGPISKAFRAEARNRFGSSSSLASPAIKRASSPILAKLKAKQAAKSIANDSPHAIIADINHKLGLSMPGIGASRILRQWAGGFFRVAPESIRLRMADSLDTHIHEIGHYLHKKLLQGGLSAPTKSGITGQVFPSAWRPELDALGRALYGKRKPVGGYLAEGWAELVRLAFTDQAQAQKLAPNAYAGMMKLLGSDPATHAALVNFRQRYQLYRTQADFTKVAGYIRREHKTPRSLLGLYDKMRTLLFDRTQPVARLKKDLGLDSLKADKDPHTMALRTAGRTSGQMKVAIEDGIFDPKTLKPMLHNGKRLSLAGLLDPVKDSLPEFETYLAAQRALEKRAQGHKGVFGELEDSEIRGAVDEAEQQFPHFKKAAGEFQAFNEWLIRDYAVGSGLIEAELAERIIKKNLNYITFRKIDLYDEVQPSATRTGARKFVDTGTGIRRFAKFEGQQIEPPLAAFMAQMESVMSRAQANEVGKVITDLFYGRVEGVGRWIDKIDRPIEAIKIQGGDELTAIVKERLVAAGFDPDGPLVDAISQLVGSEDIMTFRPGLRTNKAARQFIVMRDGKPTFWEAKNSDLFDFLEGVGTPAKLGMAARLLTIPRSVYRAGATALNPEFFLVNFWRDWVSALVNTDARKNVKTRVGAVWKAFTSGDPGELYRASGADLSGLYGEYKSTSGLRSFDPEKAFGRWHVIRQYAKRKQYGRLIREVAASPLYGIARLNDRFELATRVAEFEANLADVRRGGKPVTKSDIYQAGQAAADITLDYQRGGTLGLLVNQGIPFFNASLQGTDRLARYIKENPARAAGRIFSWVVAPSVAIHLLNRDREEYWNLPQEARDRYWHIPLGDPDHDGFTEFLRIPKPYGLGAFAVLAERTMQAVDGLDPVTGERGDPKWDRGLSRAVWDQFRPPYYMPVFVPAFELVANYSVWRGAPIVRRGEQFGPVEERGGERSSHLAYALAPFLGVEPVKIDYAINGLFAGLGTNVNDWIVSPTVGLARDVAGAEPKPQRKTRENLSPEDMLILRRFLFEEAGTHSETLTRFWETYDELSNAYQGYTQRESSPERADRYYATHQARIDGYKNLQPYKSEMDKAFQQLRQTYADTKMGAEERRKQQKKLIDEIHALAREGLQNFDKIGAGDAPSQ